MSSTRTFREGDRVVVESPVFENRRGGETSLSLDPGTLGTVTGFHERQGVEVDLDNGERLPIIADGLLLVSDLPRLAAERAPFKVGDLVTGLGLHTGRSREGRIIAVAEDEVRVAETGTGFKPYLDRAAVTKVAEPEPVVAEPEPLVVGGRYRVTSDPGHGFPLGAVVRIVDECDGKSGLATTTDEVSPVWERGVTAYVTAIGVEKVEEAEPVVEEASFTIAEFSYDFGKRQAALQAAQALFPTADTVKLMGVADYLLGEEA